MFYDDFGTLDYSNDPYRLVVWVDPEIGNYYRSLVPKYINLQKQRYPSHISVVRKISDIPNLNKWGKYQGKEVKFKYSPEIHNNDDYFWLEARCEFLEEIRLELGLTNINWITCSPDGRHRFHITIGNLKGR